MNKFILAATAAAALGVAAPAADAAFPGQNGPILFGNSTENGSAIFSTPFGGSPSVLIETTDEGTPDGLDTTADGTRVLYNQSDFTIWTANADGSGKKQLTPAGREDFTGAWSPDGRTIVFSSREVGSEDDWTLWTMNADGTNRRQLGSDEDPVYGIQPSWSPDGTKIAFTEYGYVYARGRGWSAIATTDPAGQDVEYLTEGSDADWAPDGKSLVLVGDYHYSYGELFRYTLGDEDAELLTSYEDDMAYRNPSVSPDGKKIVAETERQEPRRGGIFDNYSIGTMNADGSGLQLIGGAENGGGAEWSVKRAQPGPQPQQQEQQQNLTPLPQQQQTSASRAAQPSRSRTCGSRRYFSINVVQKNVRKVSISVNGKKVTAKRKGRGFTARVDLRKLPKGRFSVKIRKTLKGGKVRTETRRYRTCVPKGRTA